MKSRFLLSSLVALSLLLPGAFAAAKTVAPKSLKDLAAGAPKLSPVLGEKTFVPFQVEGLANATVAYLDYDYFREKGVNIPSEGLRSPQLRKEVLDAFGWMTRRPGDPNEAFNGAVRTLYAYFYGGYGLGGNIGSGRSAALAEFDIKGLPTPLIKSNNIYHSNGAAKTIEGLDEAIWSRILDGETTYGSNRVVAVIFTGTTAQIPGEDPFPRALIIREMGLRPAHFMLNDSRNSKDDRERVLATMNALLENLPFPPGFHATDNVSRLRAGMFEHARREAITQAELFAKRIYFGSNSPSNLELRNRRLDLGDHTAVEGYTKIYRIDDESPFGETEEFKRVQADFRSSLRQTLPPALAKAMPSDAEVDKVFDLAFAKQRQIEMAKLTGAPVELMNELENSPALNDAGNAIVKVAMAGNTDRVFMEPAGYKNTSRYNLGEILSVLASSPIQTAAQTEAVLTNLMPSDPTLRAELARSYFNFYQALKVGASRQGINDANLKTYMREAALLRNRTRSSLIRGDRRWHELWGISEQVLSQHDGLISQKYVESQIENNRQTFKDAAPFQLVLREHANAAEGWSVRRVYDLRAGRYTNLMRISRSGDEWLNASLLTRDGRQRELRAPLIRGGKILEFDLGNEPNLELNGASVRPHRSQPGSCRTAFSLSA